MAIDPGDGAYSAFCRGVGSACADHADGLLAGRALSSAGGATEPRRMGG